MGKKKVMAKMTPAAFEKTAKDKRADKKHGAGEDTATDRDQDARDVAAINKRMKRKGK